MRVRLYWPNCPFWWHREGATPAADAYWVEATPEEAARLVWPRLSSAARRESELCGSRGGGNPDFVTAGSPYCFLVSADLSVVDPMEDFYPFSNLWNGDSPFRLVAEREIASLDDLGDERGTGAD